ncbi:MAG TPA: adenylate/guanylate cyclase domain-containing protein [Candidatus Limnocylindrales bacterium]|jgi:class 3 adenylate cyclase
MSFSVAPRTWPLAEERSGTASRTQSSPRAAVASPRDPAALRRASLRFADQDLERRYQRVTGAESRAGFQVTTGSAAALWFFAAAIIPAGTPIPLSVAIPICVALALLNEAALLTSDWAETVDRQHAVVAALTSINGLAVLWLASAGRVLPGYGISALMLLFAFGFVSRTGFVFATFRSVVIAIGFSVAVFSYPAPESLLVDAFIFAAAVFGMLFALRLLERSRRRVFAQEIVITAQAEALGLAKERVDALLSRMLPNAISKRLLAGEETIADEYPAVTVLFADIVGFTPLAARLSATQVIELLDWLFSRFDELVAERGLEKVKTIGDAYMAAGGLSDGVADDAARVVDLALAMMDATAGADGDAGHLQLRIGVHTGPVIGGVIGHRKVAFDIWGDTVNVASRLESQGYPGVIQISDATWQLVSDRFEGIPRGSIDLRGHGDIETYSIVARRDSVAADQPVEPGARDASGRPAPSRDVPRAVPRGSGSPPAPHRAAGRPPPRGPSRCSSSRRGSRPSP